MADPIDLAKTAADALVVAREYAASEAVRSVIRLLDAIEEQYKADLEAVSIDNLVRLQTALRQVSALRKSLTDKQGYALPKII
jgi:hypothetical protein